MIVSKLTKRSQTTVPRGVRSALGLGPGEKIGYIVEGNRVVLVNASATEHKDPVLTQFLAFVAKDLEDHPARVVGFPRHLLERARALTGRVPIDHDAPIEGAVAL
jgi:antitoxin PrlF